MFCILFLLVAEYYYLAIIKTLFAYCDTRQINADLSSKAARKLIGKSTLLDNIDRGGKLHLSSENKLIERC